MSIKGLIITFYRIEVFDLCWLSVKDVSQSTGWEEFISLLLKQLEVERKSFLAVDVKLLQRGVSAVRLNCVWNHTVIQ